MFLPILGALPELWVSGQVYGCPSVVSYLRLQNYWGMQLHLQQIVHVRVGGTFTVPKCEITPQVHGTFVLFMGTVQRTQHTTITNILLPTATKFTITVC
jgi:hypothetical protein